MRNSFRNRKASVAIMLTLAMAIFLTPAPNGSAADHGDGPLASANRAADIGDVYMFLDPNDNSKLIALLTIQGFMVPGEAHNFTVFDSTVRVRFNFETTGDATPDQF